MPPLADSSGSNRFFCHLYGQLDQPRKFHRGGQKVRTAKSQAEIDPLTEMKPNIKKSL